MTERLFVSDNSHSFGGKIASQLKKQIATRLLVQANPSLLLTLFTLTNSFRVPISRTLELQEVRLRIPKLPREKFSHFRRHLESD